MRVAVIRGDLPGPVLLADLEPVSQYDPPIEVRGQERYLSRPTTTSLGVVMSASVPASFSSTGDITLPVTINAGNQTLKIRLAGTDPFTSVLVPTGTYATVAALVAAVNTVMPSWATAVVFTSLRLALQTTAKGTGTRLEYDTTAGGSTFNTPAVLAVGGANFTVPAAATVIAATVPIGGPIAVSAATILIQCGTGLTQTQVTAVQDALAPRFIETVVAVKSFQVGSLSQLLSANFNPDPSRLPPITPGAAIAVVQDDGTTPFTAPLPNLSNAQLNVPVPGAVTLTGTGLAHADGVNLTTVKFPLLDGSARLVLQGIIEHGGGVVSPTSIVIPAALVPLGVVAGCKVEVQYTTRSSNQRTL